MFFRPQTLNYFYGCMKGNKFGSSKMEVEYIGKVVASADCSAKVSLIKLNLEKFTKDNK